MKQKRERAKRRTQSLGYFFPGESINSEAEFALDRLKVLLLSKTAHIVLLSPVSIPDWSEASGQLGAQIHQGERFRVF